MKQKLLLTSFQTWLPHQKSNSSDDLIAIVEQQPYNFASLFCLRQLPVNIEQASQKAIAAIKEIKPDAIICCGMAESRQQLTIESNAVCQNKCLYTSINLPELVDLLVNTNISNNAGKFVCEGLYYQVLNYIQFSQEQTPCLFVHVPKLDFNNLKVIQQDFCSILFYLSQKLTSNTQLW